MIPTQPKNIYWQKQGVDMLCAVHTINSLLQGPFFNEIQLAQIALALDKKQKQLMQEQGMTKQFLKYMAEQSGNVALSGNYSIQVLVQALKQYKLQMIPIKTLKNQDLTSKTGFICNSQMHWFTIRKISSTWYNLNSTNSRLPQVISDFYLAAFLSSVQNCGYQIFSVQGQYPQSYQSLFQQYNQNQNWYQQKRIIKYHQKRSKRKGYKPNITGAGDDQEMEKAIAASLGKKYQQYQSSGEDQDWNNQAEIKNKQIKAFSGNAAYMTDNNVYVDYQNFNLHEDDYLLICSIKTSLQQAFKQQPSSGISIAIRHPDGKKQRRVFDNDMLVYGLYDYVWKGSDIRKKFYLVNGENKQKLIDLNIPIGILTEDGEMTVFVQEM